MRTTSLLLSFLFISTFVYAKKYTGVIIYSDKTVPFTYSEFLGSGKPSFENLQNGMKYKDENGEKHKVVPSQNVLEIQFFHEGDTSRKLKVKRADNVGVYLLKNDEDYLFLKLVADGSVQLFHYYYSVPDPSHPLVSAVPVYKRANDDVFTPSGKPPFREALSEYFKDCPKLSKSIAAGEYKERESKKIVEYYNEYCQ